MATTVSALQTSLERYIHPDVSFLDALNEVLEQLASKGVWKDLTFEHSVTLEDGELFFTLPEDADSILHGIVNDRPSPIKPLWSSFIHEGASTGRGSAWFGIEDAGLVSTKEILGADDAYMLYIFPDFNWGENEDAYVTYTDSGFTGTETVTIEYENFEGVVRSQTETIAAGTDVQVLAPRGLKNIRSISYTGFDVEARIVASPSNLFGQLNASGGSATVTNLIGVDSDYTTQDGTPGASKIYSLINEDLGLTDDEFLATAVTASALTISSGYGGTSPIVSHPVVVLSGSHTDHVYWKVPNFASGYESKTVAILKGSGVVRYRLFRHHNPGNRVHLLLRRAIPKYTDPSEIVYLDNLSALKYALLANTAEHNNDPTQARAWWAEAKQELDDELSRTTGAALPEVRFDPSGGAGGVECIQ